MEIKGNVGDIKSSSKVINGYYLYFDRSNVVKTINMWKYDGEFVIAPSEGVINFKYVNGKFSHHQKTYRLWSDKYITKYLYYFLLKNKNKISFFSNGTTVKRFNLSNYLLLDDSSLNKYNQQQIINIIEPFEKVKNYFDNLYNKFLFIKNKLINLVNKKELISLREVCEINQCKGKIININDNNGNYRYINCSKNIHFTSSFNNNGNCLLITTRGTICTHIVFDKWYATNNIYKLNFKYMHLNELIIYRELSKLIKGTTIPMITKSDIERIKIVIDNIYENIYKKLNLFIHTLTLINNVLNQIIKNLVNLYIN